MDAARTAHSRGSRSSDVDQRVEIFQRLKFHFYLAVGLAELFGQELPELFGGGPGLAACGDARDRRGRQRVGGDGQARDAMREYRALAIPPSAIADAIAFAIGQPLEVDVNEIIVRPAASTH